MGAVESIPQEDLKQLFAEAPTMFENCACGRALASEGGGVHRVDPNTALAPSFFLFFK